MLDCLEYSSHSTKSSSDLLISFISSEGSMGKDLKKIQEKTFETVIWKRKYEDFELTVDQNNLENQSLIF